MNTNRYDPKTGLKIEDHRGIDLNQYYYGNLAAKNLGMTFYKFKKLNLRPDKVVTNPRHQGGAIAYLYKKDRIDHIIISEV
ncbi:hypothetical protein [Desulfamplus magnetovallimortis]|nr:hypothetical protein [Desulfamplus magnetovallimortis]